MATFIGLTTDALPASVSGPVQQIVAAWRAYRAERQRQATIARELASYTDRQLFDLGIQRADFPAIIKGTYRR